MHRIGFLRGADYKAAADALGIGIAEVKAVATVEARESGFIKGTDLPKILFEGHHFHRLTGGRYKEEYPHISYPKWTTRHYKGGRGEYDRLTEAISIHMGNPEPALLSTSWGMFQIMGFNHDKAGFDNVEDFVNDLSTGEPAQLRAFVAFIRATGLGDRLRNEDWEGFARKYNGPGFRKHGYHTRIATEFARELAKAQGRAESNSEHVERGDIVALQTALNVVLGDQLAAKLVPDGWAGEKTRRAIRMFQRDFNLEVNGRADDKNLLSELGIGHGTPSPVTEEV